MATYSHSKLSTFSQCRYKYKLQYIDGVKIEGAESVEAFMGSRVHEALEKLYKDLKFQKLNSLKDLLKFYRDSWDKSWTDDIIIVKKDYSAKNYKLMGEKYLTDYYNNYAPFDQMTILGLETQDRLHLPDGNHYHVRMDKLGFKNGVYYVCDYKSNNRMKDQQEADEDRQLAMYSIWVKNTFKDAKKVVLLWHMLAFNKEVTSERTDAQLKKLQDDTMALIKEVEKAKEFPTKVTALCDYCSYKSICPAWKHDIELELKTAKEFKKDAGVKMVDEYSKLQLVKKNAEEKMEELKDEIILFAKQKGIEVVFGSNKKAAVREYLSVVLPEDKTKLIALLKKKGLYDVYSMICYSRLNSDAIKGEIDSDVDKMVDKEKGYRVSLSNRKEDD